MSHEDEIGRLRSIMAAAADEIEEHWEAHCDADGFGPVNLVRRLRTGKGDYRKVHPMVRVDSVVEYGKCPACGPEPGQQCRVKAAEVKHWVHLERSKAQ